MSSTEPQVPVNDQVRAQLQGLEGVRRVVVDDQSGDIVVVCDRDPSRTLAESVRTVLAEAGIAEAAAEVVYTRPGKASPQRRVRFIGVEMGRPHPNFSTASVTLEWQGKRYVRSSEGEGGAALELRVCAQATIDALHEILEDEVTFQLVGVKAIRIFDHDLVAVLLHSPQEEDRRLVGLSLVTDDMQRSGAMAVLNATNRVLGNYLEAP